MYEHDRTRKHAAWRDDGLPAYEIALYESGSFPEPPAAPASSRVAFIHYPWYWSRFLNLFQVMIWCMITVTFLVLKVEMAEVDDHDERNYFTYLTNWGWTYETFYCCVRLIALLASGVREIRAANGWAPGPDYLLRFVYEGMFLSRLGLDAGITIGVLVVLWDSPGLVTNYIVVYGGSTVLTVNTLVHVIPLGMAIIDTALNRVDLRHLYNRTFRGLMVVLALNFVQPVLILFLYASHSSPGDVYNLTSWVVTVAVIAIFFLSMTFAMALVILMHSPFTHVRILWPRAKVKTLDYGEAEMVALDKVI